MIQICKFDKDKDLGKVIPGLFPDVEDLITSHKIGDTASQVIYNELSDIKDVGFRVNEEFDAIMLARALRAGIAANQGTGSSQQAGSSAPVSGVPSGAPTGSQSGESASK